MRAPIQRAAMLTVLLFAVAASGHPKHSVLEEEPPRAFTLLAPADRPGVLYVATNFGLLYSSDDGATWEWVCEDAIGGHLKGMAVGPGPGAPLFASVGVGLRSSRDGACTWTAASGEAAQTRIDAIHPDAGDVNQVHVLALYEGPNESRLLFSTDAGQSFSKLGPITAANEVLTSFMNAPGEAHGRYITGYLPDVNHGFLARMSGEGRAWSTRALGSSAGSQLVRLLAVDRAAPESLYLHLADAALQQERLALTTDGGATVRVLFELSSGLSAFLPLAGGRLLISDGDEGIFVSADGGASFVPVRDAPRALQFAERGGKVFAASEAEDGFLVHVSKDGGHSWSGLLHLSELRGPKGCLAATCEEAWAGLKAKLPAAREPGTKPSPQVLPEGAPEGCAAVPADGSPILLVLLSAARGRRRLAGSTGSGSRQGD